MSDTFRCIRCESSVSPEFKVCPYCGEPITDFLRRYATEPVDGKYQIIGRIGSGGMGEVFKAHHVHLNTTRVLKRLRPNLSSDADAHERFLREARLATRIHHPNVATLHDFAKLPDGSFYMIWEYIEGRTLSDVVARSGAIAPRRAAQMAIQALQGLDAIHKAGVIHRDISPDNIMITRDHDGEERVKIIDLGIAKQGGDVVEHTQTGVFIGKLKYCSPEHLGLLPEGEKMDGRADIYSFGIVFYEMLTGVPPFVEDGPQQYFLSHARKTPLPLRTTNPRLVNAPELETIIFRALEKDREKRFASAKDFATAIERILPQLESSVAAERTVALALDQKTVVTDAGALPTIAAAGNAPTMVVPSDEQSKRRTATATPTVRSTIPLPVISSSPQPAPPPAAAEPTVREPIAASNPKPRLGLFIGVAIALFVTLAALATTIWYVRGAASQLARQPATTSNVESTPAKVQAAVMPGQTLSVQAPPLPAPPTETTATDTVTAETPAQTATTTQTAATPPPTTRESRKKPQPLPTPPPTETAEAEPQPDTQPAATQQFAPGKGRRLVDAKEFRSGFTRGFLPDYAAMTKGDAVDWSWVAPGVRLSNYSIRIGRYRNLTSVTGDTLMNWLTTEMQTQVSEVTSGGSGSLTTDGAIYWAERDEGKKRGVGIELMFRDGSGRVVAMMRHRINENTPEDAAEEMAEAVAEFVESNR